ncbi:N-acetyltransferase family protein [Vibrio sp. ZSDE26]|uniref:N-acetyltransferase family protein n=1 Tax=Vibrio amylolyticus TaxID=2847292 RepID=A0A9X2BFH2_9VIBR|nr:GNAT family N-acetyltransferase [Vibrio amylolyticus]MCK6261754.1 N-acetyltransferase family protein [Vibrio amylolyticus]
MKIRKVNDTDLEQLVAIYNHYVESTTISFEEEAISVSTLKERIKRISETGLPWVVAEIEGEVQGYAYASQWNARSAYKYTVEPSIYLSPNSAGKGIGKALYTHLLTTLESNNIKNAIAVIALPNRKSIALHERMGFKKVGEFDRIGIKFGKEVSVSYWQLKLEAK